MNTIDYTQYAAFQRCPAYWYERYHRGIVRPRLSQRDDALTLGTLVHALIESHDRRGVPEIDPKVIEEVNPTPECLQNAMALGMAWIQEHPEQWEESMEEVPLVFPLPKDNWQGLAKVDKWFRVRETMLVQGGVGGPVELEPGYWLRDYKTYSSIKHQNNYFLKWNACMQADFQMLALACNRAVEFDQVKGLLIGVMEKPYEYVPKRKCKGCGQLYEFSSYRLLDSGLYACGWCQKEQELTKLSKPAGYTSRPNTYYIKVTRSPEQLEQARRLIGIVAGSMQDWMHSPDLGIQMGSVPRSEECVDIIYGPCEYYTAHVAPGFDIDGHPEFVKIDTRRYMNAR